MSVELLRHVWKALAVLADHPVAWPVVAVAVLVWAVDLGGRFRR